MTSHAICPVGRAATLLRSARLALGLTIVLAGWLAFASAPASAALRWPFVSQLTGAPSVSFGDLYGGSVAVDAKTGDTFVADSLNGLVYEFDSSHNYLATWNGSTTTASSFGGGRVSVAADDSTGDVYVLDVSDKVVDQFDSAGNFLGAWSSWAGGSFADPAVITVDQATNDVYVLDTVGFDLSGGDAVYVFDSAGAYQSEIPASSTPNGIFSNQADGLAIDDKTGDVLVADGCAAGSKSGAVSGVEVLSSAGVYQTTITGANTPTGAFADCTSLSVAADNATGDIYVSDNANELVDAFDSSGNYIGGISGTSSGSFSSVRGVSVDQATGDVAVSDDGAHAVDFYSSPPVVVPDVTTGAASGVTGDTATLNGTANPDGMAITDCHFELGTSSSYGQNVPCGQSPSAIGAGSSPVSVTAAATGLLPGTTYHFRLDASNANGENEGVDGTFTTPAAVVTGAASSVTRTSATLTGTVNPLGQGVSACSFQYGADSSYGQSIPCAQSEAAIGTGSSPVQVTADLTGLHAGTVYHFRLVAGTSSWSEQGQDAQLLTLPPPFAIASFDGSFNNQDGSVDTQAGSHPYSMTTSFSFPTTTDSAGNQDQPVENFKDVEVDLPAGLVGNPTATTKCTHALLATGGSDYSCPASSQVGLITLDQGGANGTAPVYNVVPPPGMPGQLGFFLTGFASTPVYLDVNVRSGGDYGLTVTSKDISTGEPITGQSLTIWGVPGDPSHDAERYCAGTHGPGCSAGGAPLTPFLTLPTSCAGPQTTTLKVDTWQNPGVWYTSTFQTHDASGNPIGLSGCDRLDFSPTIGVQPTVSSADSPSGLNVDLQMPQDGLSNPTGLAEANLKDASVTLPNGVSVDPSAANGLGACTPAQIGIDNANEPTCPNASKIGSVEVDTPLLADPLTGGIYVAQQDQNPFGSLLAIYVTAEADGVLVKLAGHVVANPVTGQLTTTFSNNPQLPFTDFKLNFFGGPRGVLATPDGCGTFTSTSDLSPWSGGSDATPSDSFAINSGCVSGFSPTFTAGTQNAQAGAYSPFVLSFSRPDTSQYMQGLTVKMPPGVLAKLAGVGLCSDAQLTSASAKTGAQEQASPSCPANSQVGTVETGAGPGSDPVFLPGKAYLTGPYKGAPYGLAEVVPAVAGPYDLGTVVVRQALDINPTTAQVTAVSDPFPTILKGIPLRLRRVDVDLNRPDFMVNPTSCNVMSVTGTLTSTLGIAAPVSSRFQAGGCAALPFKPKLTIKLSGKGQTRSGDHPTLTGVLTARSRNEANAKSVRVTLPLNFALDPNNSQVVCPYSIASAVTTGPANCPAATKVGTATAITPLLSQPLTGPVYLVQGLSFKNGVETHTLPTLLIPLRGQIAIDLRAQTSVSRGKLVTTFQSIPDAFVQKFTLHINGGHKGILVITGRGRSICGKPQVTRATLGAQSGKSRGENVRMATPCRKKR